MWNRLAPYVLRLFGRHGPSPVKKEYFLLTARRWKRRSHKESIELEENEEKWIQIWEFASWPSSPEKQRSSFPGHHPGFSLSRVIGGRPEGLLITGWSEHKECFLVSVSLWVLTEARLSVERVSSKLLLLLYEIHYFDIGGLMIAGIPGLGALAPPIETSSRRECWRGGKLTLLFSRLIFHFGAW